MSEINSSFLHIQGDKNFQERSDSVFSSLDRLEPPKEEEKELKKSVSRRPHVVPDHVLHPEKWTKYSLEEDGSESLGRMNANEINKHAALSFLDELKGRRESGDGNQSLKESADCDSNAVENKHSFSKPNDSDNAERELERKSLVKEKEGVHMMPEYVIGKTKLPAKSRKLDKTKDDGKMENVQIEHLLQKQEDELVDSDVKDSVEGLSVPSEESEKGNAKKEEVKFAKRKRKQDKNIRKHAKTSDDEEKD